MQLSKDRYIYIMLCNLLRTFLYMISALKYYIEIFDGRCSVTALENRVMINDLGALGEVFLFHARRKGKRT